MESSIWLLAYLYSREKWNPVAPFLNAVGRLHEGMSLFSPDFLEHCPEFLQMKQKYTQVQLQSFLRELCRSVEKGHLLVYPGHELFPKQYLYLEEVPMLLRVKGSPVWMALPGLSVVGSRDPSPLSLSWMDDQLAQFFRSTSCYSISGGARGVDQKTHLVSLRTGRPTVVLLPSGLDRLYPTSLQGLVEDVLSSGGALISEYEDLRPMQKHFFAQRNRLISGLGMATLVIEARRRSGTLLTAQEALEQSRPLWVLPGHPLDSRMQGSLDLFKEGATPVQSAEDLSLLFNSEKQDQLSVFGLRDKYLVESSFVNH